MDYQQANRLVLMLTYNFAGFLPNDPVSAAGKKGLFIEELKPHEYAEGEKAVKTIIQTSQYPPTVYDLKQALGVARSETQWTEAAQRLTGPTAEDNPETLYTANMARVDKLMADLDKELANMPNSLAKGRR